MRWTKAASASFGLGRFKKKTQKLFGWDALWSANKCDVAKYEVLEKKGRDKEAQRMQNSTGAGKELWWKGQAMARMDARHTHSRVSIKNVTFQTRERVT